MDLKTLEKDLITNATHLERQLVEDIKEEGRHIADPEECGNIVQRHFSGLTMTLLLFVALFVAAAIVAIFFYTHR